MQNEPTAPPGRVSSDHFAATRWSLVAAARRGDAGAPLAELCVHYWYPVYAYVRRCGHAPELAQAISLSFFHWLLSERLREVDPGRYGRFRSFMLAEVNRYVSEVWRGEPVTEPLPGLAPPLPTELLEARYRAETPAGATPERAYQQSYASEVLTRAHARVRAEAVQAGRDAMFDRLQPYLAEEPGPGDYEAIGRELGMPPLTLVVAVKRLRQRFRELVDEELCETVGDAEALASERAQLHQLLRSAAG
jgi:RNA polymerase sigma-70 factor (ECF subfamily)